jgi:hypothetical protein
MITDPREGNEHLANLITAYTRDDEDTVWQELEFLASTYVDAVILLCVMADTVGSHVRDSLPKDLLDSTDSFAAFIARKSDGSPLPENHPVTWATRMIAAAVNNKEDLVLTEAKMVVFRDDEGALFLDVFQVLLPQLATMLLLEPKIIFQRPELN